MPLATVLLSTLALAPGLKPLPRRAVASAVAGGLFGAAAYAAANGQRAASESYDTVESEQSDMRSFELDGVAAEPAGLSKRRPDSMFRGLLEKRSAPRDPVLFWDDSAVTSERRRSAV